MMTSRRRLGALTAVALAAASAACANGPTGLAGEPCGPLPHFTVSPVAQADVNLIVVIGGLGAPGHTLPTAHSGFSLARENVPVASPGRIQITEVRRVTYVTSPTREGERDYAVFFSACEDVEGWLGHLISLAPGIPDNASGSGCQTYSTADETVEACTLRVDGFTLEAGDALGAGGLSAARGFLGLDFGLLDSRVSNFYANPARHPEGTFHAVCPYEYFDAANRAWMLDAIRDPARPTETPAGQPRCGTMEVDVGGTAKGVWAEPGVTGPVQGDETRYITLANYPYDPQGRLALSLGPAALGARVAVVPRQTSGRVDRAFEQVTPDGLIYCYRVADPTDYSYGLSWLLTMPSATTLALELVEHPGAPGPCGEGPATWQLSSAAQSFVR
jgi:hypothetical protein